MDKPKTNDKQDHRKSPDTLAQPGANTGIELTEEELEKISGGANDPFIKMVDVKLSSRHD